MWTLVLILLAVFPNPAFLDGMDYRVYTIEMRQAHADEASCAVQKALWHDLTITGSGGLGVQVFAECRGP